jgi:alkylation response protein AidB-like acyl-CoA dehydrogenase
VDFQFDEVQQSIRQMVKTFVDREVRPVAMAYELEDRYPTPIVEKMRSWAFLASPSRSSTVAAG